MVDCEFFRLLYYLVGIKIIVLIMVDFILNELVFGWECGVYVIIIVISGFWLILVV